jgi:hypothetical protein
MRNALMLIVVPACLAALPAFAASPADDAELERVRSAIAEAIAPSPDPDMPRLELAEPVSAARCGGHIVVSLKQAKLIAPDEGATLVIGDVDIAVRPRGDGYYAFDVTMPQRFEAIEHGVPEGVVTIASYGITGVWASEVESLTKLDVSLAGIDATDLTPETANFGALIETLEARLDYVKGPDGLWSGTSSARVAGVKVHTEDTPDESDDLMLAAIETSGSTTGWDWSAWHRVVSRFEQSMAPDAAPLSEEEWKALANELRSVNWGINEGAVTIKGMSVGAAGEHLFDLGEFTWKLAFDGAQEAGPLTVRLALTDLSVTENELPPNLAPSKAAFDVTLEHFPVRAFLGSLLTQIVGATAMATGDAAPPPAVETEPLPEAEPPMAAPPESEPMVDPPAAAEPSDMPPSTEDDGGTGMDQPPADAPMVEDEGGMGMDEPAYESEPQGEYGDAMPMPDDFGEPPPMMGPLPMNDPFFESVFSLGTAIVLNELSVDAPSAGMAASGRVEVDPEAVGMGTGRVKATLRGIDSVLAYVESQARLDPEMKDISTFLIFLKGLGRAEVGANSEVVYVYDINVPKEEPPTVNGYLIDEMMFD